jgi:hypothetical protein
LQPSFDASSEAAQLFLLQACDDVKTATCAAAGCGGGGLVRNGVNGKVLCPMEIFAAYLNKTGVSFPAPQADFLDLMYKLVTSEAGRDLRKHVGRVAALTPGCQIAYVEDAGCHQLDRVLTASKHNPEVF